MLKTIIFTTYFHPTREFIEAVIGTLHGKDKTLLSGDEIKNSLDEALAGATIEARICPAEIVHSIAINIPVEITVELAKTPQTPEPAPATL